MDNTQHEAYVTYDYIEAQSQRIHQNLPLGEAFRCSEWRLNGYGPDGINDVGALTYDMSNGLRSRGDLIRTGPKAGLPCLDAWVGQ